MTSVSSKAFDDGIVEVVVAHPPVNALPVAGWFALADAITAAGRDRDTRVVVLRGGQVAAELGGDGLTEHALVSAMEGEHR